MYFVVRCLTPLGMTVVVGNKGNARYFERSEKSVCVAVQLCVAAERGEATNLKGYSKYILIFVKNNNNEI